jgi:hypothetical protein
MDRREFTATRWFTSRLVVGLLFLTGLYLFMGREAPGYEWLARIWGGESHVTGFGLCIAFMLLGLQSWRIAELRLRMAELMEAMHQLLYGKDYQRDREAIEILVKALELNDPANAKIAHEQLMRLTGLPLAQDPKVWRAWWDANKQTFARAKSGADAAPKS